jgi:hypothetical protein
VPRPSAKAAHPSFRRRPPRCRTPLPGFGAQVARRSAAQTIVVHPILRAQFPRYHPSPWHPKEWIIQSRSIAATSDIATPPSRLRPQSRPKKKGRNPLGFRPFSGALACAGAARSRNPSADHNLRCDRSRGRGREADGYSRTTTPGTPAARGSCHWTDRSRPRRTGASPSRISLLGPSTTTWFASLCFVSAFRFGAPFDARRFRKFPEFRKIFLITKEPVTCFQVPALGTTFAVCVGLGASTSRRIACARITDEEFAGLAAEAGPTRMTHRDRLQRLGALGGDAIFPGHEPHVCCFRGSRCWCQRKK